MSKKIAAIKL